MARGVVESYRDQKGWGGISSDAPPSGSGCWVRSSAIEGDGYRTLAAGDAVELEPAVQDSWRSRATRVVEL